MKKKSEMGGKDSHPIHHYDDDQSVNVTEVCLAWMNINDPNFNDSAHPRRLHWNHLEQFDSIEFNITKEN